MKILDKKFDIKFIIKEYALPCLIILDLLLITISFIFIIPYDVFMDIQLFDLFVCIVLIGEYFYSLFKTVSKKDYVLNKENIIGLFASIPFDFILPLISPIALPVIFLRYLRLFKLIRIFNLSKFDVIKDLFKKTGLHKILLAIICIIVLFTFLFMAFGPSYDSFDDLYYVIVTLTTVGYGDIYPKTHNEKVLAIILILIGIFVFSTITAAISSFLTDRIIVQDEEDIAGEIKEFIDEKSEDIMVELEKVKLENQQLKSEINELKKMIEDNE
ncbi:MAG: potassium channel protein [Firmicutes bacterium]|nr:potassium channel protein [Bacillota bacterium]